MKKALIALTLLATAPLFTACPKKAAQNINPDRVAIFVVPATPTPQTTTGSSFGAPILCSTLVYYPPGNLCYGYGLPSPTPTP